MLYIKGNRISSQVDATLGSFRISLNFSFFKKEEEKNHIYKGKPHFFPSKSHARGSRLKAGRFVEAWKTKGRGWSLHAQNFPQKDKSVVIDYSSRMGYSSSVDSHQHWNPPEWATALNRRPLFSGVQC